MRGTDLADGSVPRSGGVSPEASAYRDPGGAGDQLADTHLGEIVLARAISAYRAALGSRLIAGYALGSLAHGGFSPLVSDVDVGLILDDPLRVKDRMTIRTVARSVKAGGSALDQRLSVFWGQPCLPTLNDSARSGASTEPPARAALRGGRRERNGAHA
jgi:hypothetical protein